MLLAQVYIDEDDLTVYGHLRDMILQLLINNGIAGATAFTGDAGFGRYYRMMHHEKQIVLDKKPLLIVFIDEDKKVKVALTELRKQYRGGFIITHPVEQW